MANISMPADFPGSGAAKQHAPDLYSLLQSLVARGNSFKSAEQTADGSEQSIPHGLGAVPDEVLVIPVDTSAGYIAGAGFIITEGTHDATNVKVTATTGLKFIVRAQL